MLTLCTVYIHIYIYLDIFQVFQTSSQVPSHANSQVQKDFPEMEVSDNKVTYQVGEITRTIKVPGDRATLRKAAEMLSAYSRAVQDLTVSMIARSRFFAQMLLELQSAEGETYACIDDIHIYNYIYYIYI